jgi:acetoin utilization deacetylase AcuC-like enzyme
LNFATYFHPQTCLTSKPIEEISFVGHSLPHFSNVRQQLAANTTQYPSLPVREADIALYETVHDKEYLDTLQRTAKDESVENKPQLSGECRGYEFCLPGYRYSLGGMIAAIDRMKAGTLDRAYTFALGGHHSYARRGHGYCLLNPMAAAVRYAQTQDFNKILIVDWDIHHGDGTQSIFANDSTVHCISIHSAADLYMASMRVIRDGTTEAAEAIGQCNIPVLNSKYEGKIAQAMELAGNLYWTNEVIPTLNEKLNTLPFTPDMIFIFSGYDSHKDDCGKHTTKWDNDDYRTLTRIMLDLSEKTSCPIVSSHGGGYKIDITIPAALEHIETLATG